MTASGPQNANDGRDLSRWIVGVDGSPISELAFRWTIAQRRDRPVVIEVVAAGNATLAIPAHESATHHAADQAPLLEILRRDIGSDETDIEYTTSHGGAASTLLDKARSADLLVMGSRGLGGFERLMLGSVSYQCATHSPTPVAVVPPSSSVSGSLERIVVGMDGSANAIAALTWAIRFARATTSIDVVGVWEPSVLATPSDAKYFDDLAESTRERFNDAVEETTEGCELNISRHFSYDRAADAIVEAGRSADLTVVGARGHGRIAAALLGSVSTKVLHQSQGPVVVIPAP